MMWLAVDLFHATGLASPERSFRVHIDWGEAAVGDRAADGAGEGDS